MITIVFHSIMHYCSNTSAQFRYLPASTGICGGPNVGTFSQENFLKYSCEGCTETCPKASQAEGWVIALVVLLSFLVIPVMIWLARRYEGYIRGRDSVSPLRPPSS